MSTLYKYRVRCVTDNKWESVWGTTAPTTCPVNTAHTIDPISTSITEIFEKNHVTVEEEKIPTNGNFQCTSLSITSGPGQTSSTGISWPYPTTALQVNFITDDNNNGDVVNMYGGKDTPIGALTANISPASAWVNQNYVAGDVVTYTHPFFGSRVYTCTQNTVANEIPININYPTVPANSPYWIHGFQLSVSSTVIGLTQPGFEYRLSNGVNSTYMGRAVAVDTTNNKIYVENNVDQSYLASSPTYVLRTVYFLKNYKIDKAWNHVIGNSKIGGSYIPTDVFIHGEYTNNGTTGPAKTLVGHVEYLY